MKNEHICCIYTPNTVVQASNSVQYSHAPVIKWQIKIITPQPGPLMPVTTYLSHRHFSWSSVLFACFFLTFEEKKRPKNEIRRAKSDIVNQIAKPVWSNGWRSKFLTIPLREISTHCFKPELVYHLEIRFAAKTELFLLIKTTFIKWHVRLDCVHGYKQKNIDSFKR